MKFTIFTMLSLANYVQNSSVQGVYLTYVYVSQWAGATQDGSGSQRKKKVNKTNSTYLARILISS